MTDKTDERDIRELFQRVEKHFEGADEGAQKMFAMLVSTTLKYRDILKHSKGEHLSIGETRDALGVFMDILKTQKIPDGLDGKIRGLVMMWLEELKAHVQN